MSLIIFFMTRKLKSSPNRIMAYAAERGAPFFPGQQIQSRGEQWNTYSAGRWEKHGGPSATAAPPNRVGKDAEQYRSKKFLLLSLVVDDQSTSIERRNLHSLKAGDVCTIGGGKSDDYLISLAPVPARLGEVQFDGKECTFVPKKPQYFPEIGSQPVPDCIGKTIRIISDKRYKLTFRLEQYEDPVDSLGRLLKSVALPSNHLMLRF
ncbi:MAG: hypothetical protein LBH70_00495 [Spirochaetaceae bacterium]|nr:hypothetical protein [Spirochaetaceae bacterium]